mgnify:CR=1 FL=1
MDTTISVGLKDYLREDKMFETVLLVCLLSNSTLCFEAHDTRGPYITIQECIVRAEEMRLRINSLNDHSAKAYQCRKAKGGSI